jgi:hypothetical protein
MTDQEINVAIAETCGFKYHDWSTHQKPYWEDPKGRTCSIPDFCSDLNEMATAENHLTPEQIGAYESALYDVTHTPKLIRDLAMFWSRHHYYRVLHADARQRSEAFLKTIGKWKDE